MKAIYVGSFYPHGRLNEIRSFSKRGAIDNATNNFQWALIKGLDHFWPNLQLITLPAIRAYPFFYKRLFFHKSVFSHCNGAVDYCGGFINIPVLKHLAELLSINKTLKKVINSADYTTIFIFSIHSPFLKAVCDVKKHYQGNLKVCLIIDDLPQFMSESKNPLYLLLKKIDLYIIQKYLKRIDSFVFLSAHMNEMINKQNKPWITVEGIYNTETLIKDVQKGSKKTILYSGSLDYRYGIINLLNAFQAIDLCDYRLWICGTGNASKQIEKYASADNRITFFGQLTHDKIIKLQREARVLVNPRTSEGEYTKYSFPSKTIEYMASGTPTIIYRLKGIPDEYYQYCYTADEENAEGLKKIILFVCEKDQNELNEFGRKASSFILEKKNSIAQVRKIYDMIKSIDRDCLQ